MGAYVGQGASANGVHDLLDHDPSTLWGVLVASVIGTVEVPRFGELLLEAWDVRTIRDLAFPWHAMGVGLILIAFASNEAVVGKCWEGSGWENTFHERFMI
eukprot:CAMPEP_0172528328 /NCGR_PEP_ID=MMETSP1067-20121228/2763_1 /TAXON_ID=265564 ORGANISM="Thalassiosira punctigera, Strain Tpunct2005C2" /NCGR_SAMPLE_ID=MMETSP1067 /ASSEMBLY_ACC=CAM_ASM_000444 /LENGTH=100 /DNA_ID=CAMNT_0013312219 /DNA_START=471 /DNA_END=774 /DNA_ORIENTATION=+